MFNIYFNIFKEKNYMKCKKPDNTYITVTSKVFYANCPKNNQLCSATEFAYVAAITVCRQRLF